MFPVQSTTIWSPFPSSMVSTQTSPLPRHAPPGSVPPSRKAMGVASWLILDIVASLCDNLIRGGVDGDTLLVSMSRLHFEYHDLQSERRSRIKLAGQSLGRLFADAESTVASQHHATCYSRSGNGEQQALLYFCSSSGSVHV